MVLSWGYHWFYPGTSVMPHENWPSESLDADWHLHHLVGNDSRLWILPGHRSCGQGSSPRPSKTFPRDHGFVLGIYHDSQHFTLEPTGWECLISGTRRMDGIAVNIFESHHSGGVFIPCLQLAPEDLLLTCSHMAAPSPGSKTDSRWSFICRMESMASRSIQDPQAALDGYPAAWAYKATKKKAKARFFGEKKPPEIGIPWIPQKKNTQTLRPTTQKPSETPGFGDQVAPLQVLASPAAPGRRACHAAQRKAPAAGRQWRQDPPAKFGRTEFHLEIAWFKWRFTQQTWGKMWDMADNTEHVNVFAQWYVPIGRLTITRGV